jgi:hypothetical protein
MPPLVAIGFITAARGAYGPGISSINHTQREVGCERVCVTERRQRWIFYFFPF